MIAGWTICNDLDADRPAYKADLLVCRHCGLTIFMCHAVTRAPLPASAVAERCGCCDHAICGWCKEKMRNGAICSWFRDRIDAEEAAHAEYRKLGIW